MNCGSTNNFTHNKDYILLDIDINAEGTAVSTGKGMKTKGVICSDCGYVMLFKSDKAA